MFYGTNAGHEGFWPVGTARNREVLVFSASQTCKVSSQKPDQNLHHVVARERFRNQNTRCSEHFGRHRDFDTLQITWQAQEFVRVENTLACVADLKRIRNDAFRRGRRRGFVFCEVDLWVFGR